MSVLVLYTAHTSQHQMLMKEEPKIIIQKDYRETEVLRMQARPVVRDLTAWHMFSDHHTEEYRGLQIRSPTRPSRESSDVRAFYIFARSKTGHLDPSKNPSQPP